MLKGGNVPYTIEKIYLFYFGQMKLLHCKNNGTCSHRSELQSRDEKNLFDMIVMGFASQAVYGNEKKWKQIVHV